MTRSQQIIVLIFGIILVSTAFVRVFPPMYRTPTEDILPSSACKGEAIIVDVPYVGTVNEPWTCQVQCEDKKQHYILYSNGKATQCQELPGCNDTGEDTGVTCVPPASSISAETDVSATEEME